MKRFFVLVLTLQLLSGGWFFTESFKTIWLREHYVLHQQCEPQINWWAFMLLHYANPSHHQKDHETHSQLPLLSGALVFPSFTVTESFSLEHPGKKLPQHIVHWFSSLLEQPADETEHPPC